MIGHTLGLYISRRFLKSVLGVVAVLFALIFVLDFVETMRRASDITGVGPGTIALISLFRTPSVAEQTLPFAVLFGAIGCFIALSRRLELIVARAAGVSVWQFLMPPVLLAALLGILAAIAFNPLSADLKARCDALEATVFNSSSANVATGSERWIRQRSIDGQAVIRAASSLEGGLTLTGVTIFTFDNDGRFQERIEAHTARLQNGSWALDDVRVLRPETQPAAYDSYVLATNLTAAQVLQTFTSPDTVSFWRLPSAIALATAAGLDTNEYRLHYQTLLARPALLVAMVLIAATVSLRFVRFGGLGFMVLGGVGAGFVLYVATKIAEDLGAAGLVNTSAAAWSPAIVSMLIGFTILLNQEDG
ncbi:LPS export ABC transporter permease LptG [Labrys wisconsinensis]|uniref:Lipopolysaccharide export system permease protein n=1 Tax=Labrys wisconsinensis TaxID=425677 RepID=A0ABU0J232_9HYPH|nr:LPS export ABC transporter permease LptG [Labrys wisconsinensis]MDQ0468311.1 lipopolysaccharide export system permease protein [Labrys wisconsinensis]